MFSECSNLKELDLKSFELNLQNFNTENVTDMKYMFDGYSNLPDKIKNKFWTRVRFSPTPQSLPKKNFHQF